MTTKKTETKKVSADVLVRFRNDYQDKDTLYLAGRPCKVSQAKANEWFKNGVCDPA